MESTTATNVISFDFGFARRAALGELDASGVLAVGQVVSYEDIANPRRESVVISVPAEHGEQRCISEDGYESTLRGEGLAAKPASHAGWRLERNDDGELRVLTAAEVEAFIETARAVRAETEAAQAEASRVAAIRATEEKAKLLEEFSYLETVEASGKRGYVLAARNMRKILARMFPGVKFSVRSSSFSMGNSVDVSWNDGPTTEAVDAIIDRFQMGDFDGSDDSYNYRHNVWLDLFGSTKWVGSSRRISPENLRAVAAELGLTGVSVSEDGCISSESMDDRDMVRSTAFKKTFPVNKA